MKSQLILHSINFEIAFDRSKFDIYDEEFWRQLRIFGNHRILTENTEEKASPIDRNNLLY